MAINLDKNTSDNQHVKCNYDTNDNDDDDEQYFQTFDLTNNNHNNIRNNNHKQDDKVKFVNINNESQQQSQQLNDVSISNGSNDDHKMSVDNYNPTNINATNNKSTNDNDDNDRHNEQSTINDTKSSNNDLSFQISQISSILNEKRRRYSHERAISDDNILNIKHQQSESSEFRNLNNVKQLKCDTDNVFDLVDKQIINDHCNYDNQRSQSKQLKQSKQTINDNHSQNTANTHHISLPCLHRIKSVKSVAFNPITEFNDNVLFNKNNKGQKLISSTTTTIKEPLSILKSKNSINNNNNQNTTTNHNNKSLSIVNLLVNDGNKQRLKNTNNLKDFNDQQRQQITGQIMNNDDHNINKQSDCIISRQSKYNYSNEYSCNCDCNHNKDNAATNTTCDSLNNNHRNNHNNFNIYCSNGHNNADIDKGSMKISSNNNEKLNNCNDLSLIISTLINPDTITINNSAENVVVDSNNQNNQCNRDNHSNNNNNVDDDELNVNNNYKQSMNPISSSSSSSLYCNCSSNEINSITYRICLNCHRPIILSSSSELPIENQQQPAKLDKNIALKSIINDDGSVNNHRNGNDTTITFDLNESSTEDSLFQNSSTFLMMNNEYDDHDDGYDYYDYDYMDRPHFCRKCNIWYGSFDPSYPVTCHCPEIIKSNTMNLQDSGSIYSINMRKDFRYYFQHPYSRLFVAYFVIFCNFLIYAEDPLSHSLMECSIPVLGNVISLLFTKYPKELYWQLLKGSLSLAAIVIGLFVGKFFLHHIVLRKLLRLKMFREESGTWMIMLISSVISCYFASQMYNTLLLMFHPGYYSYLITSKMGITYALFMKIAACGTWCGDFFTAWMITDMMLQDNLYPKWAISIRKFWHEHANIRIAVFWSGSMVIAAAVIAIILTELICWDCIAAGIFSTTEFSRAFLASSILVMDLLIVMQDWDFPHFVSDLNIKLPGLLQPSYTLNFFHKSLKFPSVEIRITGKWFNYGIIVFVMMLDLNMWKNQVIYYPPDYGQYVDLDSRRVCSITDERSIAILHDNSNRTIEWTFENRSQMINPLTNRTFVADDLMIYARYFSYPWIYKMASLIPILAGFIFFLFLVYFYGRFPPKTDASLGGRLPKRKSFRSSWHRERRDTNQRCKKSSNHHHHRKRHITWPGIATTLFDDLTTTTTTTIMNDNYKNNNNSNENNKTTDYCIMTKKASMSNNDNNNNNESMIGLNEHVINDENFQNNLKYLNHIINILKPRFIMSIPMNTMKICALILPINNQPSSSSSSAAIDLSNTSTTTTTTNIQSEMINLNSINIYDMSTDSK